jgi:hypothetical protein
MKFGDLTARVKKTIWETFLRKVPTEAEEESLSVRHLTTALEASEAFEVDFKEAGSTA